MSTLRKLVVVVTLVLLVATSATVVLADGPGGLPMPEKIPGKLPVPPLVPELPAPETEGEVEIKSTGNLWFSWNFGFFTLTVLRNHWGSCGPYGYQWHRNVILKRYEWQNDNEAWANFHVGSRQSHCVFVWESRSSWSREFCWNPPSFDDLWTWIYPIIWRYGPWSEGTTWYVSYFITYLVMFLFSLAL